jgi:hypothetical protein
MAAAGAAAKEYVAGAAAGVAQVVVGHPDSCLARHEDWTRRHKTMKCHVLAVPVLCTYYSMHASGTRSRINS